uniref:Hypothetical 1.5K protein n=1 Tax=Solanum lycopersicum TaxID=4081 RepID=Q7M2F2_SOLLC
MKNYDEEFTWI